MKEKGQNATNRSKIRSCCQAKMLKRYCIFLHFAVYCYLLLLALLLLLPLLLLLHILFVLCIIVKVASVTGDIIILIFSLQFIWHISMRLIRFLFECVLFYCWRDHLAKKGKANAREGERKMNMVNCKTPKLINSTE